MNVSVKSDDLFVAGSMYWAKPDVLSPLHALYNEGVEFEPELGQVEGTMAHAIERIIGIAARSRKYGIKEFGPPIKKSWLGESAQ